jgi:hypothetical protein
MLAAALAATLLGWGQAGAQESLADQKLQAEINKLRAEVEKLGVDTTKASLEAQLAAMKQLQGITGGTGDASGAESSAEGALLVHHTYDGVSARLARIVAPHATSGPPVVVFGSAPPSLSDLLAFRVAIKRLEDNLQDANRLWALAQAQEKRQKAGQKSFVGVLTTIGMIASVADLFTVDTVAKGAAATVKDEQFDTQLSRALAEANIAPDYSAYEISSSPRYVTSEFKRLEPAYAAARRSYLEDYMPAFMSVGGKVTDLPPSIAAAGKNLEVAISDYDVAKKALLTSTAGVLPATVIDRQVEWERARGVRPILYIRSHRAAVTTTTKRGFFVGWDKPPIYLTGAAIVDYVLVTPMGSTGSSISCITSMYHFTDLPSLTPKTTTTGRDGVCLADKTL